MASNPAGGDLRSGIRNKLQGVDPTVLDALLQYLQRQGVTSMEDLEYVTPMELVPILTMVQARKLLKSYSDKSKPNQSSWLNLGKMSLDEYEKKKRELYVRASRLKNHQSVKDFQTEISQDTYLPDMSCRVKQEPDSSSSSWSSWKPEVNIKTPEFVYNIVTNCVENKKVKTAGAVLGLAVVLVAVSIAALDEMNWAANRTTEAAEKPDVSRLTRAETVIETAVDNMEERREGPGNNISEDGRWVEGSVDLHRD